MLRETRLWVCCSRSTISSDTNFNALLHLCRPTSFHIRADKLPCVRIRGSCSPNTRMKGSISMAKRDYDNIPMHSYNEKLLSPRYRQYTKSREQTRDERLREMSSRQLSSRGLSPRGPHSGVDSRFRYNNNRLLNSAGSAQHPTVVSQDGPAWMAGSQGHTTNRQVKRSGIRTNL